MEKWLLDFEPDDTMGENAHSDDEEAALNETTTTTTTTVSNTAQIAQLPEKNTDTVLSIH